MAKELNVDVFLVDMLKDKYGIDLKYKYYDPRGTVKSDKMYSYMNDPNWDVCDCTTRAIAIALDRPYNDVLSEQFKIAKRFKCMPILHNVTEYIMGKAGWVGDILVGCGVPVITMLVSNPSNRYFIGADHHAVAIIGNVLYDRWNPKNAVLADVKRYLDEFLASMCSIFYIPA